MCIITWNKKTYPSVGHINSSYLDQIASTFLIEFLRKYLCFSQEINLLRSDIKSDKIGIMWGGPHKGNLSMGHKKGTHNSSQHRRLIKGVIKVAHQACKWFNGKIYLQEPIKCTHHLHLIPLEFGVNTFLFLSYLVIMFFLKKKNNSI